MYADNVLTAEATYADSLHSPATLLYAVQQSIDISCCPGFAAVTHVGQTDRCIVPTLQTVWAVRTNTTTTCRPLWINRSKEVDV